MDHGTFIDPSLVHLIVCSRLLRHQHCCNMCKVFQRRALLSCGHHVMINTTTIDSVCVWVSAPLDWAHTYLFPSLGRTMLLGLLYHVSLRGTSLQPVPRL